MRHPVRVLNPKETRNQPCPVFPNRTPGRQPSISHGCKVAGSTFWLFLKFQRRLRIAHQNWTRRSMYGFRCLRQMCAHCTWCNILSALSFCFIPPLSVTHKSESGSIGMQPLSPPHRRIGWYTCDRRLLQLACRSLCIPPPTADAICLLASTTATSRAWLPHRCGGGELRLRNFGGRLEKTDPVAPKDKNRGKKASQDGVCGGMQDALRTFRKVSLQLEHSGPSLRSWELFTSHTQTLCEGGPAAPLRDAPLQLRAAMARCRQVEEGPTNLLREGALSQSVVFPKKQKKKKKRTKICLLVGAGRKGSAESRCICVRLTDPPSTVPLEARVVTHTCQLCPRSIFFFFFYGGERDPNNDPVIYSPPVTAHMCSMLSAIFQHISIWRERFYVNDIRSRFLLYLLQRDWKLQFFLSFFSFFLCHEQNRHRAETTILPSGLPTVLWMGMNYLQEGK